MADHQSAALDYLAETVRLEDELTAAYAAASSKSNAAVIAGLHQQIGRNFKAAEVHALLAVRQGLDDLAWMLDRPAPPPPDATVTALTGFGRPRVVTA